MENKNLLSVPVKTELNSTVAKKYLLCNPTFSQLNTKNSSNTRLPSFKPPRDLFLTGSSANHSNSSFNINNSNRTTKKTFMPNINITRKKCLSNDVVETNLNLDGLHKTRDKNKKLTQLKKRNSNIVQTKGVFSEGLAPAKVKAFGNVFAEKAHIEKQVLDKPKLNLNQKINKIEDESKLKSLLKDEIDDPNQLPDISLRPNSLPLVVNFKKTENFENLEKNCDAVHVKSEKFYVTSNDENLKQDTSGIASVFEEKQNPKLFLFEFPSVFRERQEKFSEKKKNSKAQLDADGDKSDNLMLLGEGFLGTLRIHENGKAFLISGKATIPLCLIRHTTKQEVMSTDFNSENLKGEVISLGSIDASFTCSSNLFQNVS